MGFRQVGITRYSERGDDGTWHDELLMELVVEPRTGGGAAPRERGTQPG